jgi:hypothetical protein
MGRTEDLTIATAGNSLEARILATSTGWQLSSDYSQELA